MNIGIGTKRQHTKRATKTKQASCKAKTPKHQGAAGLPSKDPGGPTLRVSVKPPTPSEPSPENSAKAGRGVKFQLDSSMKAKIQIGIKPSKPTQAIPFIRLAHSRAQEPRCPASRAFKHPWWHPGPHNRCIVVSGLGNIIKHNHI